MKRKQALTLVVILAIMLPVVTFAEGETGVYTVTEPGISIALPVGWLNITTDNMNEINYYAYGLYGAAMIEMMEMNALCVYSLSPDMKASVAVSYEYTGEKDMAAYSEDEMVKAMDDELESFEEMGFTVLDTSFYSNDLGQFIRIAAYHPGDDGIPIDEQYQTEYMSCINGYTMMICYVYYDSSFEDAVPSGFESIVDSIAFTQD
ncbi:MAG: hypothetical protein J5859_04055 [Clostridia bacterium]|nr:hypothetical protein [Clostridia bacterium]